MLSSLLLFLKYIYCTILFIETHLYILVVYMMCKCECPQCIEFRFIAKPKWLYRSIISTGSDSEKRFWLLNAIWLNISVISYLGLIEIFEGK